jgi:hypothetical protein
MKNRTDAGFEQHYNAQVATDQASRFIVAHTLSNHTNDKQELIPTLDAMSPQLGQVEAVAADQDYFSEATSAACFEREIEPYLATGRQAHHRRWRTFFAQAATPPPDDATPKVKMAYQLQTKIGQAIYRLRKSTVEPIIGIIKEVLGFRQFSLRGLEAAAGEWALVGLAFNLKRWHVLSFS